MKRLSAVALILTFFFSSFRFAFVPTIVFDAAAPVAPVSSRASGHLYGLAEEGVPDPLIVESLDVSSVSQKVIDGLQHPIGDVDHVVGNLPCAEYLVVYLQDNYSTWYYDHEAILESRKAGTYDWRAYLREDYFPKVRASVEKLKTKPYADRLVYCPFNECDNGLWFGTWMEGNWCAFDEAGQANFLEAWKETFGLIRSIDPEAAIGGPGYCDYSAEKEAWFLNYCAQNGCLPDVMIWHELGELSSEQMDLHVKNYRVLEELSDVSPLPIIITEYGMMEECGNPAKMFRYVRQIEETGVYGNIAYWRLSDNLNDNTADGVSPNACWWLYRWYADMSGDRLEKKVVDLFHADFGKAVRERRNTRNRFYNGFGALNETKDRLSFLLGGADYTGQIHIKNMDKTALGKKVRVKVESVTFEGLGGEVFSPTLVFEREFRVLGNALRVKIRDMDPDTVYHVEVTPATGEAPAENKALPVRYEFERGELLGDAYTYDSAYATTGEVAGMVGGMEREGDGVRLTVTAPEAGLYDLTVVYGKHNDLGGADGRVPGYANFTLNGETKTLKLQNTIKSEYTRALHLTETLNKGKNELVFTHEDGTFVLDSLLVKLHEGREEIAVLRDEDRGTAQGGAFLLVSPEDGWYAVDTDAKALTLDGSPIGTSTVYLRRGLNLAETVGGTFMKACFAEGSEGIEVLPADMTLTGCEVQNGRLVGITSAQGSAAFTVGAPASGNYRVVVAYANNFEGGAHDYNVDLIETYLTLTVNGEAQRIWCRSTASWDTVLTSTVNVTLQEGENALTLTNDGEVRFNGAENQTPQVVSVSFFPVCE